MTIKKYLAVIICLLTFSFTQNSEALADNGDAVSTKKERNRITKGNTLYNEGHYREAMEQYQLALQENPSSIVGRYNLGLSQIQLGMNRNDTSEKAKKMLEAGIKDMQQVAALGNRKPELASRANYNLGNVAFNSQDFQNAINYYKQALRLNPSDNEARRNLRIAQLKLHDQNQDQDNNQDKDKDQDKDQEKEQEKEKKQDQQDNKDQKDQNQDQNNDQQQQQQPQINQQTAEQILNAVENKENQTRSRVAGKNAEKSRARNRNRLNW